MRVDGFGKRDDMLVFLCDECHAPIDPETARKAQDGAGGPLLCEKCRTIRAGVSPPPACEDGDVAVSPGTVPGGGLGDRDHPFGASSGKERASPGLQYRCHVCHSLVDAEDLKRGRAIAQEEKVFCSTCKRRVEKPSPPEAKETEPHPYFLIPDRKTRGAPNDLKAQIPTKTKKKDTAKRASSPAPGAPLECDLCHRTFTLEDLRSGKAEIRDARVLCPRCISRIDRGKRRFDYRFVASLGFILVVFPLLAALLTYVALSGDLGDGRGDGDDPGSGGEIAPLGTPDAGETPATPTGDRAPDGETGTDRGPSAPAKPPRRQPPSGIEDIGADDLDQIIRNLETNVPAAPGAREAPSLRDLVSGSGKPRPTGDPEAWREMLDAADPAVRLEGVMRAASGGADSALLLEALSDEDPFVRSMAAGALGKRREKDALLPLLKRIRDPDAMVRYAASRAVVEIGDFRIKHAEDFSAEELEGLKKVLDRLIREKGGK